MESVEIRDESIRLGQLLKLHGVADNGSIAKDLVTSGEVTLNGEVETRRGATVRCGDVVAVTSAGLEFTVTQRG